MKNARFLLSDGIENIISEYCPHDDCDGTMEFWMEQVFYENFLVKSCDTCSGIWVQDDDGEWLDSTYHWDTWKRYPETQPKWACKTTH